MYRFSILNKVPSCAAIACLLTVPACGGNKSDPGGVARDSSSTATGTTTSSSTSSSGSGGSSSTSDSTTGGAGAPGNCIPTAPPNATITDFSAWDNGNWGADGNLTGGSFPYSGDNTTDFAFDEQDGALHVTGTVNDYAGLGLWFGPCVDASAYAGVSFTIGGSIGDMGQAVFQVQQSDNHEVETVDGGLRGDCSGDCSNNQVVYDVPSTPAQVSVCFADMSGGTPNGEVDSSMLYALQYQFNCATDGMCALDVTVDDIMFTSTCP